MRQVAPTERVGGEVREQNIGHALCVAPTRCELGPTRPRDHVTTVTRVHVLILPYSHSRRSGEGGMRVNKGETSLVTANREPERRCGDVRKRNMRNVLCGPCQP